MKELKTEAIWLGGCVAVALSLWLSVALKDYGLASYNACLFFIVLSYKPKGVNL